MRMKFLVVESVFDWQQHQEIVVVNYQTVLSADVLRN